MKLYGVFSKSLVQMKIQWNRFKSKYVNAHMPERASKVHGTQEHLLATETKATCLMKSCAELPSTLAQHAQVKPLGLYQNL